MCDLDIHIVLKDRETKKVIEYSSIGADGQSFGIDDAKSILDQFKKKTFVRNYK